MRAPLRFSAMDDVGLIVMAAKASRGLALLLLLTGAGAFIGCESFGVSDETTNVSDAAAPDGQPVLEGGPADAEVNDAGMMPFVLDTFSRTETGRFGVADVGGEWRVYPGNKGGLGVIDGLGRIAAKPGGGPSAIMETVAATDVDLHALVSTATAVADGLGSGLYVSLVGRRRAYGLQYSGKVSIKNGGVVGISVARITGSGTSDVDLAQKLTGIVVLPNEAVHARFQFVGTNPTRLRGKLWTRDEPEPDAWDVEATDTTPELQQQGSVGLAAYFSMSATAAEGVALVDDFLAMPAVPPP